MELYEYLFVSILDVICITIYIINIIRSFHDDK